MIYLILDTNTWIYLANSGDPLTKNSQEGHHIKLFLGLEEKVKDGSVEILTNDIIRKEWESNRQHASELIEKYKRKLEEDLKVLTRIQTALTDKYQNEVVQIKNEYVERVHKVIAENENHVKSVENLLQSSSHFGIQVNTKVFVADWAIQKKFPFVKEGKNNMADALILFSAIEYIREISQIDFGDDMIYYDFPTSIFVSGNKTDFCSPENADVIHSELKPFLDDVEMGFFRSLPMALQHVDKTLFEQAEIDKMEQEMLELDAESSFEICEECSPEEDQEFFNVIWFSSPIEIINESPKEDPTQLKLPLKELEIDSSEIPQTDFTTVNTIQRGECSLCGTEHIKCQSCQTVTAITDRLDNPFRCSCGLKYKLSNIHEGSGMLDWSIKIIEG